MTAILKVDTIQDTSGNNIINESSNTITIGASGDTISIPSGATITNSGTATGFGGGKVLQVIYAVTSTQVDLTSTTWTDVVSASITPASSSNKVLALAAIGGLNRHSGDTELQLRILRDSTAVGETKGLNNGSNNFLWDVGCSINELDAPSSTSSLTYKIQINNRDANGTVTASSNGADTSITLLEIEGW